MKRTMIALLSTVVVFWNVENLFDSKADSSNESEISFSSSGSRHWTSTRLKRKCQSIAKVIMSMADEYGGLPSAVGLCEVENDRVLRTLLYETPLHRLGYRFVHEESSDPRGIDCALLYRPAVLGEPDVSTIKFHGTRDVLVCRFDSLCIMVCHLPSKLGTGSGERRSHIMECIGFAADSLSRFCPAVIAGGDFNEQRSSVSDSLLAPLHELDPILESGSVPGSIKFSGNWETIDRCTAFGLEPGAELQIYAHPLLLEEDKKFGGVKPRRTYIGPRYNGGISDHLPMVMVF